MEDDERPHTDDLSPEERQRRYRRFVWDDDEPGFEVIRYDDEARRKTVEALLAESREMLKGTKPATD